MSIETKFDSLPGSGERDNAETSSNPGTVQIESLQDAEIPTWNLRPVPEYGHLDGASARQRKRMEHIENNARGILTEDGLEGSGTIVSFRQGYIYVEHVVACEPIPECEMVLPKENESLTGVFVPLWPVGAPEWLRDITKLSDSE